MSFIDCIKEKVGKGGLTEKQAIDLEKEYQETFDRYKKTMESDSAAEGAAMNAVMKKREALVKKSQADIQDALYQKRVFKELNEEKADYEKFYNKLNPFAKKAHRKPSIGHQIANRLERTMSMGAAINRRMLIDLYDFIDANRSKLAGLTQNTKDMPDVVRAILGQETKNPSANTFGRQIREKFTELNKMFDQAGGHIGFIENYFPQVHDGYKLLKVSADEWIEGLLPLLDRERMVDFETGLPLSDEKLLKMMREDYESITTNGLAEMAERAAEGKQTFGMGQDLYARRSQSRFYQFKDADSFLEYNAKFGFGEEGLFDAIFNHIESMSRDIGIMKEMGPKPNAMMRRFNVMMEADPVARNAPNQKKFVNGMYDVLTGKIYRHGTLPLWYEALEGTKDVMRSAYLSLASVSALTDMGYQRLALKMNGLPSKKVISRYGKLLASSENRKAASRLGFITGAVQGRGVAAARYADDSMSRGITKWMSNFTNRASGLQIMTDAGRMAPMLELMGFLADSKVSNTQWKSLNPTLKATAKQYGITKSDWDIAMQADLFEIDGGAYLRPQDIVRVAGISKKKAVEISYKFDTWATRLGEQAVNEPTLRTRTITSGAFTGSAETGTVSRAFWSSVGMFKSFAVTNMQNFFLPILRQTLQDPKSKAGLFGEMALYTTFLGALAIQGKDILKGRDPRPVDDWKFWRAAALQGGGLGLFGDFMFADHSRFGRDLTTELAGPVFGLGSDVWKVAKGNLDKAIDEDQEANFIGSAAQLIRRTFPVIKTPYTSLFVERVLFDSAEKIATGNDFRKKTNRIKRNLKKNYEQGFWWEPGTLAPQSLPDFSNVTQE